MFVTKFMLLLCVFGNAVLSYPTTSDFELLYPGENAKEMLKSGRDEKQRALLSELQRSLAGVSKPESLPMCDGEDCDDEVYDDDGRDGREDTVNPIIQHADDAHDENEDTFNPEIQHMDDVRKGKEETNNPKIESAQDRVLDASENVVANATEKAPDANEKNQRKATRINCDPENEKRGITFGSVFTAGWFPFTKHTISGHQYNTIFGLDLSAMYAFMLFLVCGWICLNIWCRRNKYFRKSYDDLPSYGEVGPNVSVKAKQEDSAGKGNANGSDRQLAHSAQMYHYQHQKQQIISMKQPDVSSVQYPRGSATESEEDDLTVYECPGLATASEMTVENPLFRGEVEQPKSLGA